MRNVLLSVTSLLAASALASDVLTLTQKSFSDVVPSENLILVEFFAPWCGHCKALAPEYEKAATTLKETDIKLAKVDCTSESDLCGEHGIQGYPTMKVFRNGTPSDYAGPRKADGIVSYMKKQSLPAVSTITSDNHSEFQGADRIVLIAYLDKSDEASSKAFSAFAEAHRDEYLFGISHDPATQSAANVQAPSVVLYKTFDEGRNDHSGPIDDEALAAFIKEHATPLLDEITPENFGSYAEAGLPLAYIFIESTATNREATIKSLEPVARTHKGRVNFVWIDATKFSDHAKSLNLQEAKWPAFAIQNVAEMLKYPMPQSEAFTAASVDDFVARYVRGQVAPSVKSEPIPADNSGPVFVLVADQFDEVVADKSKDMFVEFYAPWCGHCKKLAPTWETLGERYVGAKDKILIAKFDAHNNDVPYSSDIKIQGFPTIKFRAAGTEEWIDYHGDRSLESLIDFVNEHSVTGAKPDAASQDPESQIVYGTDDDEDEDDEDEPHHDELVRASSLPAQTFAHPMTQ